MTPASPLIHTNAMNEHHERMIEDPADLLGPGSRLELDGPFERRHFLNPGNSRRKVRVCGPRAGQCQIFLHLIGGTNAITVIIEFSLNFLLLWSLGIRRNGALGGECHSNSVRNFYGFIPVGVGGRRISEDGMNVTNWL